MKTGIGLFLLILSALTLVAPDGVWPNTVEFPVPIANRGGHQGLVATYSTMDGTERNTTLGLYSPQWPKTISTKNDRYYFAYTFDQYLYQSNKNPKEGFGLLGSSASQTAIPTGCSGRVTWASAGPGLFQAGAGTIGVSATIARPRAPI